MSGFFLKVATICLLFSCVNCELKRDELIGNWSSNSISIGFIHANIQMERVLISNAQKGRLNLQFRLELNMDSTFELHNEIDSVYFGKYFRNGDSLVLEKDNLRWLNFKVKEVDDELLKLMCKRMNFVSYTLDSVELFTGENIEVVLKRNF